MHTSDLATGSVDARNEAARNRIAAGVENNGRLARYLGGYDSRTTTTADHDHRDPAAGQIGCDIPQIVVTARHPVILDGDVLAFVVPEFGETVTKSSNDVMASARRCAVEKPD